MGRAWVRLDVGYYFNPKTRAVGKDGRGLHLASICWSHDHLTDGHISEEDVKLLLLAAQAPRSAIRRLEDAGLWERNGHGWIVHDYLLHQESREEALAKMEGARERVRRWRATHRGAP